MPLEKYVQTAKEEFPYLFEEYGFKMVFREEEEGQGLGRGGDVFGLESDIYTMRILFSTRGGGNVIFFGPLSALFFDEHFEWVTLVGLLVYLTHQDIDWSELEQTRKKDLFGKETQRVYFRLQSRLLKPHCPRVLEMFSSDEEIAVWKPRYEEFIRQA